MSHNPRLTNNQTIINTSPEQKQTTYTNARVTSIQTEEGTTNYSYAYQSNISQISKGSESFSFTYDGTLLTSISQAGQLNQSIDYTYNNDFTPTSMTYAGQTENYTYDDDGELTSIGAMAIAPYMITREQKNRKVTLTDGTYTKTTKLNKYGELKKQKDNTIEIELKRNPLGEIVKKEEKLFFKEKENKKEEKGSHHKKKKKHHKEKNKKESHHKKGSKDKKEYKNTYRYTYDSRGRLTKVRKNHKTVERYTYDSNGNRQSATVNNQTITASYTLDDNLVVYGDNTYLYDDDGYLTEKTTPNGTTTYSYGTLGELKQVITPTKTITYKHNANNQRVAKLIDGAVVEKYLWADLTTLLATYDANDTLKQRFEYANGRMPIAMTDASGTKYYLHYDQVGSLRAVSDAQMNIVKEITYDTFGNVLTDSNPTLKVPFGFAGGLYDSDTKLTRFGYRDYDAYTGKWTAKDPIGFQGGDSNLYGYVLGDPVNFVDPWGLSGFDNRSGGHGHNRKWDNSTLIGPALLFGLNPRLDSPLERHLANHFFFGNGTPYYLTNKEWEKLQNSQNPALDPCFDQGIGALNPGSDGSIDTYDFYPLWGSHRTLTNNMLNLAGGIVGYGLGGDDFKIYPPK